MSEVRILVAGIGNIFLGDDAFGCEVLKRLNLRSWPENVRIFDFGMPGFDLSYALLDRYDLTILVDASPRGDAPGTVYVIEPDLSEFETLDSDAMMLETHGNESGEGPGDGEIDGRSTDQADARRL